MTKTVAGMRAKRAEAPRPRATTSTIGLDLGHPLFLQHVPFPEHILTNPSALLDYLLLPRVST
jgi:hypothetical protein